MRQRYNAEVIRLPSGERLPALICRDTLMPHGYAMDYSLAYHRGIPINTSKPQVDSIGMFHSWGENLNVDLDRRFGTGDLFTSDEVSSLSEALWEKRIWDPKGGTSDKQHSGKTVVGTTQATRTDNVIAYLKWRMASITSSLSVSDPRLGNMSDRLSAVVEQLKSLRGESVSKPRGELTEDECVRLFEIVRPGSPENPFHRETQLRNFFILLMYYELGVRKAEPLVLKGNHIRIGPQSLVTFTYTLNDPLDARKDQPAVKTVSRTLPISPVLAKAADRLIRERHSNERIKSAARRTPFVVLSTDTGSPLSLDAAYDIFVVLRTRYPRIFPGNFSPHQLRRSWNHRFSEACLAAKIDENFVDHIRRYVMGWSKTSAQPANYNRKFIEEQAFTLLMRMQNGLTGIAL